MVEWAYIDEYAYYVVGWDKADWFVGCHSGLVFILYVVQSFAWMSFGVKVDKADFEAVEKKLKITMINDD